MKKFWKCVVHRVERLILSAISKSWLAFYMATWLVYQGKIGGEIWAAAMGIAVGANAYQKIKGVLPDLPKE